MVPSVAALPRSVFCATDFLAAITQHISQAAGGVCLATAIGPRAAAKPPRLALQGLRFGSASAKPAGVPDQERRK